MEWMSNEEWLGKVYEIDPTIKSLSEKEDKIEVNKKIEERKEVLKKIFFSDKELLKAIGLANRCWELRALPEKDFNEAIKKAESRIAEILSFKYIDNIEKYVEEKIKSNELILKEAKKFTRIFAVQGQVGQKVQTILADGTVETTPRTVTLDEKTNEPGWIVKNADGPEKWIIDDSVFKKKYEIDPESPEVFKPKGGPMLAGEISENICFKPPKWGGDVQMIKKGAYILRDPNNESDIYGIGEEEFAKTYEFTSKEKIK